MHAHAEPLTVLLQHVEARFPALYAIETHDWDTAHISSRLPAVMPTVRH